MAKACEFKHPRFKNLLRDKFTQDLGGSLISELPGSREQVPDSESMELSVPSLMEGKVLELVPQVFQFLSTAKVLSKATLIGEGKLGLFGRVMFSGH